MSIIDVMLVAADVKQVSRTCSWGYQPIIIQIIAEE